MPQTKTIKNISHQFKNISILEQALSHSSFVNEQNNSALKDNERLEFLGDAVLNVIISHMLMEKYPDKNEGELSQIRAGVVNETQLAVVARKLAHKKRQRLSLLEERPLFHVPALLQTQVLLSTLEGDGVRIGRTVACSSMELVKSLVLDGAGVGVLPYRVATHGVAEGRLIPLSTKLPGFDDRITLVWRADAPMTAGLRTVIDALLDHGRGMPALPRGL